MKPRLFLDVDGVFLAHFGDDKKGLPKQMQLRPYAGSFLLWASKHFDLYWLTCHGPDSTKQISYFCSITQFDSLKDKLATSNTNFPHITYASWFPNIDPDDPKALNYDKVKGVIDHGSLAGDWLVLEDGYPCYDGYDFINANINYKDRWIVCPADDNPDVLIKYKQMLDHYLKTGKLKYPWPQPEVDRVAALQWFNKNKK